MNKKIKKVCMALCLMLGFASNEARAQQTSMVIDNQTPGWLSSKIEFTDQVSVENLKVTGYLDETDFDFLKSLSNNRNLKVLDLEEVHYSTGNDKYKNSSLYKKFKLKKLIASKYIKIYWVNTNNDTTNTIYTHDSAVDSLIIRRVEKNYTVIDAYKDHTNTPEKQVLYLEFPEGVEIIKWGILSDNISNKGTRTITIPSTIRELEHIVVGSGGNLISYITDPEDVNISDCNGNSNHYCEIKGDTLFVPSGTKEKYLNTKFKTMKVIIEMAPPTQVLLNKSNLKLYKDDEVQLLASIIPQDAYFKRVIWKSSNQDIAEVTDNGMVRAKGYGQADIIVCSEMDETIADTCHVEVFEHVTGIDLSSRQLDINLGESEELVAETLPLGTSDNEVIWSSSNNDIASVDEHGRITGVQLGTCTIKATAADGGSEALCVVSVVQPAKELYINKHKMDIKVGGYEELHATILPDNTTNKLLLWSSSDSEIAEVSDQGIVIGKKAGNVNIFAQAKSNPEAKDSCEVTVLQPVTGITLSDASITLGQVGATKQLTANVEPDDASDKSVNWNSSNPAVCIVAGNGLVVAIAEGISVVTAVTVDGSFVAVCVVTVSKSVATGMLNIDVEEIGKNAQIFNIEGKRQESLRPGLNIIKMDDGSTKKIVIE